MSNCDSGFFVTEVIKTPQNTSVNYINFSLNFVNHPKKNFPILICENEFTTLIR